MRLGAMLLLCVLAGCAGRVSTDTVPVGTEIAHGAQVPNPTVVAVYLPSQYRKSRVYLRGMWVLLGKALEDGVGGVMQHFFPQSFLAESDNAQPYGLLLAIEPEWKFVNRDVQLTMNYRVFSKDGEPLLTGQQAYTTGLGDIRSSDGVFNAAVRTTQLAALDMLKQLNPNAQTFPAVNHVKDIAAKRYVKSDKPYSSGTGFFINHTGQVLTAAHVLHDCAMIEVRRDDKVFSTRLVASSALLDLAVIDTGDTQVTPLPLRKGEDVALGEPVANVGFPLQSILGTSPSLTRGNVSSRSGLTGSVGQFQFSAPIQPGASGGPVVSDEGELLGVTVATLNPKPLIEQGILPQNVNFALEARYVAEFLRHNNVAFTEVAPNAKGDMQTGNQAALAAAVSVACYQ